MKKLGTFLFWVFTINLIWIWVLWPQKGVYKLNNLPAFGKNPVKPIHEPLIKLAHNKGTKEKPKYDPFCSGFVIDANYALTAAHCISTQKGSLQKKPIRVLEADDTDTKVTAIPAAINNRLDVGLIKGDFSKFALYRVDFYNLMHINNPSSEGYLACGFPYGQRRVTCVPFYPRTNVYFSIGGSSFLIPGMSGGPVLDLEHGVVIGINIAMGNGLAFVAPTTGALGAFGIEPKRK